MLLHPLKSELNYPIDLKSAIDLSPTRWDLPTHCLSCMFPQDHAKAADPAEWWTAAEQQSGFTREAIAAEVATVVEQGKKTHKMQRNPHLVLLDTDFYHTVLKPKIAKWMLIWLHRASPEDLTQFGMTNEVMICYMNGYAKMHQIRTRVALIDALKAKLQSTATTPQISSLLDGLDSLPAEKNSADVSSPADDTAFVGALVRSIDSARQIDSAADEDLASMLDGFVAHVQNEALRAAKDVLRAACSAEKRLPERSMKMLNLSAGWCQQFMPHTLSKIDRVTFGLLGEFDPLPQDAPLVRKYMAVPFVAKDVPSHAAEFAHPDVLIGLTILAYRYEGLRVKDIKRIIKQIKFQFSREQGDKHSRPSALKYALWVELGKLANATHSTHKLINKLEARTQAWNEVAKLVEVYNQTQEVPSDTSQSIYDLLEEGGLRDLKKSLSELLAGVGQHDWEVGWTEFQTFLRRAADSADEAIGRAHELAVTVTNPEVEVQVVSTEVLQLVSLLRDLGLESDAIEVVALP